MRFFELLNYQHVMGSILVALIVLVLFAVGLAFMPLVHSKNQTSPSKETHTFADNIEEGNGPFPLVLALIITGTLLWAIFYILYYGFSEVNI
ncbi:MAG: hypothetical protein ABIK68_24165 [bacterium]|nr:hypothetical protein [bacterium]